MTLPAFVIRVPFTKKAVPRKLIPRVPIGDMPLIDLTFLESCN